jgi:hypothetical protein
VCLIYHIGWAVSPYAGVTTRTAVTKGFDYSPSCSKIVDFMDPFFLTEPVGFIYDQFQISSKAWSWYGSKPGQISLHNDTQLIQIQQTGLKNLRMKLVLNQ